MTDDARAWSRAKQVLESALERTPEERPAFLDRACGADNHLRLEIESLLAAHDAAENFAERPAIFALDDSATDHPAGDHDDGQGGASLKPGDDLGPYRIAEYLGAGGMGEVYRATDTRLHRSVALKILSHELRDDPDRRQRFEREARAVAALRHPHICVLHDIGQADGVEFLVMEFLDGESLAARLTHGPLPLHQALRYGIEIADALGETHRQGIVHRDLKPGNIMLTAAGAKLLDFGIAKRQPPLARGGTPDASESLTAPSAMLGTLHYMAPEQLEGKDVDARTDLFALGAVLYEMVTGKKAFDGDSQAGVVAAILERQPAPLKRGRQLPIGLEALILKCLAKKPDERWQRAGEVVDQLRRLSGDLTGLASSRATSTRWLRTISFVALAALIGGVVAWGTGLVARTRAPQRTGSQAERLNVSDARPPLIVGNLLQLTPGDELEIDPSISPDGKFVAYSAGNANQMRVFIRSTAGGRPIPLTDEAGALEYQPRWSPDGNEMLYVTGHGAFVVPPFGGTPRRVDSSVETGVPYAGEHVDIRVSDAVWSPDGHHVGIAYGGTLSVVTLDRSERERVLTRSKADLHHCSWSPNGTWIACTAGNWRFAGVAGLLGTIAPSQIVLVSAKGGPVLEITDLTAQNQSPTWSRDGKRLYFVSNRQGSLDIYAVEIAGDGHPLGAALRVTTGLGAYSVAFAAGWKHLAYTAYSARANIWSLSIPSKGPVDTSQARPVSSGNQIVEALRVSPDDKWLVFDSTLYGNGDIFRVPIGGGPIERLTTHPAGDFAPDLSPDGRLLTYHSWRTQSRDVFVQPLDGGPIEQVTGTAAQESYPSWFPDGRSIMFYDLALQNGVHRIQTARRERPGRWSVPVPLDFLDGLNSINWMPDHRSVAYLRGGGIGIMSWTTKERRDLYQPAANSADPYADNVIPARDGTALYFKSHNHEGLTSFWSVPVKGGRPVLLVKFDDPSRQSSRFDFALDAGHFYFTIEERLSNIWIADVAER